MNLEYICDRIDELEELKHTVESELDDLYQDRQELWEAERAVAHAEYERSAV